MAALNSPPHPEPYVDRSTKRGVGYGVYWLVALVVFALILFAILYGRG